LGNWVTLELSQSPIKSGIISFRDSDSGDNFVVSETFRSCTRLGQRRSGGGSTDDDMVETELVQLEEISQRAERGGRAGDASMAGVEGGVKVYRFVFLDRHVA
jgi:hypothetical protein